MAPQTKVQCFAAKDKKAKLERWEFEPVPLQPLDVGVTPALNVDVIAIGKHLPCLHISTYIHTGVSPR